VQRGDDLLVACIANGGRRAHGATASAVGVM
jgi:hypothetical protein